MGKWSLAKSRKRRQDQKRKKFRKAKTCKVRAIPGCQSARDLTPPAADQPASPEFCRAINDGCSFGDSPPSSPPPTPSSLSVIEPSSSELCCGLNDCFSFGSSPPSSPPPTPSSPSVIEPSSSELCCGLNDGFSFGSSPPSSPPPTPSSAMASATLLQNNTPIVVLDRTRKLEVQIYDPEYKRLPGTEILKLSTEEYFRRFKDDKSKALKTIKHLNNRVEMLQRELSIKEKAFKVEKEEDVSEVRKLWKNLVEGNTRSGKIVQMASRIRK